MHKFGVALYSLGAVLLATSAVSEKIEYGDCANRDYQLCGIFWTQYATYEWSTGGWSNKVPIARSLCKDLLQS